MKVEIKFKELNRLVNRSVNLEARCEAQNDQYQEMLGQLCDAFHVSGAPTFESAIGRIETLIQGAREHAVHETTIEILDGLLGK